VCIHMVECSYIYMSIYVYNVLKKEYALSRAIQTPAALAQAVLINNLGAAGQRSITCLIRMLEKIRG
jgi:hypothetical protein